MSKKQFEAILYSFGGVIAMFVLIVGLNAIGTTVKQRVDLTAEKLYTLSDGTKAILSKLDGTVDVRLYVTQGENEMPVQLKNYAQRVEDLLGEYKQVAGDKLNVQKLDPEPDSDAEDKAQLDGVEGQMTNTGEQLYLGMCVSFLDKKVAIPFLAPDKEKLLEYEVSRAIAGVLTEDKPVIGIMSGLPVMGAAPNPMMARMGQMQGQDPWVFVGELKRDYTVEEVQLTAESIDSKIKVLVVVHPKDISEKTQYAIDQFIMRGGKVIALVDPTSIYDRSQQQQNPMMGMGGGSSSLNTLFNAWGVKMEAGKVIADQNHPTQLRGPRGQPQANPTFLSLNAESVNTNDVLTSQIDNLLIPFAGALSGTPSEGLTKTVLIKSSKNSQLVEGFLASMSAESVTKDFKSSGIENELAIRLTGKFKTAFPNGKPKDAAPPTEEKKEDEKKDEAHLTQCTADNAVIIVADADWLNDQVCVQIQNFFGQRIVIPFSGNLTLIQNMVDLMGGDSNLISVRSRATVNRPFTVINEMQAKAQEKYQTKIKELETSLADTQKRLNELQQNKEKGQRFILSPEQQKELEKFREQEKQAKVELKNLRKNLRQDIDALENKLKWGNIIGMPLFVTVVGVMMALIKRKRTSAK